MRQVFEKDGSRAVLHFPHPSVFRKGFLDLEAPEAPRYIK
jgi:hypothetical protein